jgi:hypothetical protein
MDIEISPTEVMRCASEIEGAVGRLGSDAAPRGGGNAGFMFDEAISRFGDRMQQTSSTAATDITTTAQDLDASATLLRKVDDDSQAAAEALWSKVR